MNIPKEVARLQKENTELKEKINKNNLILNDNMIRKQSQQQQQQSSQGSKEVEVI